MSQRDGSDESRWKVFADEEAIETAVILRLLEKFLRLGWKVFADEEAIETESFAHAGHDDLGGWKVFADEEAIETFWC